MNKITVVVPLDLDTRNTKLWSLSKYLHLSENTIAARDRSGKACEEDTGTLLILLQAYGDVIWQGMNYFGISEEDMPYYQDWHNFHKCCIASMKAVLDGEAKFKRI